MRILHAGRMTRTRIAATFGVLALALAAGALALWSRPPDGPIVGTLDLSAPISTLTLDRSAGLAFALSPSDGRVVVLDARTAAQAGALVAPAPLGANASFALWERIPLEAADRQAFLTDDPAQHVYALAAGGAPSSAATALLPGLLRGSAYLAVDADAHRLFVLADAPPEGLLSAYDARTLRPLWVTPLRSGSAPTSGESSTGGDGPLVVDALDARVIAGHLHGSAVSVVDAINGRIIVTLPLGPALPPGGIAAVPNIAIDARVHRAYASVPDTGAVTTIDLQRGRVVRTAPVGVDAATPLVDARTGRVVVASLGAVSVLDARSGALVRTTFSTQTIDHYPVAVDGRSGLIDVAGFNDRTVDIFDGTSGRFRRGTPVPGVPEAITADDATGRVLVVVGHQSASSGGPVASAMALCALDGATGRLRRVLPLGASTRARLYLDGPAHRALVLLDGGPRVPRPDPWGLGPGVAPRAPALRAGASAIASTDRPRTIRRDRRVGHRYGGPLAWIIHDGCGGRDRPPGRSPHK